MKSVLAFLAINAFLVAVNVLFAGLFVGVITIGRVLSQDWGKHPVVTLLLGFTSLGLTIWTMVRAYAFIVRKPSRGRGTFRG